MNLIPGARRRAARRMLALVEHHVTTLANAECRRAGLHANAHTVRWHN